VKYFAYGSNMLEARLKHPSRVPSATCVGVGVLVGFKLRFHKIGKDGSGKCNALETGDDEDSVYGVVFDVAEKDRPVLDGVEDLERGGYSRRRVDLIMEADASRCLAECYLANPEFIDDTLHPFGWYKALVIAGAREHDLPEDHIRLLEAFPSVGDGDRLRVMEAKRILASPRSSRTSVRPWGLGGCPAP